MSPIFHLFTFLSFFLLILDFLRLFDLPMNLQLSFRWKYLRFETTRVFDFSYMSIFEWYTKCDAGEEIILFLKGIVRSKISRGYIKVDSLGGKLLFTRTKSDKNWPRYGASNTTRSKQDFCPTLAELKSPTKLAIPSSSQNNQPIKFVK